MDRNFLIRQYVQIKQLSIDQCRDHDYLVLIGEHSRKKNTLETRLFSISKSSSFSRWSHLFIHFHACCMKSPISGTWLDQPPTIKNHATKNNRLCDVNFLKVFIRRSLNVSFEFRSIVPWTLEIMNSTLKGSNTWWLEMYRPVKYLMTCRFTKGIWEGSSWMSAMN